MNKTKSSNKSVTEEAERKRRLERPRHSWNDNIKMDRKGIILKEIV
jgi:hypothetical protein